MAVSSRILSVLLFTAMLLLAGCANDVGDIDRTQPNKLEKADLDGVWYMLETVTDLPATSRATIEGETSRMEKIVWVIEENYLFAYRAYELVPGSGNIDTDTEPYADGFRESPVAAYRITSHFDVQREYNSSTGEQTNVLVENTSDRPWYERDYIRVDWSRNEVSNFDFISEWLPTPIEANYQIDSERELPGSIYFERDEETDELVYFDVPRRVLLQADIWGCIFSSPWYGWSTEDCAPADVEMVTSFARTESRRDYEPLPYSDQEMSRFGLFRSERYVYDDKRGVLESTRQELANRHNIWQQSYQRDGEGNYLRSDDGRLVPLPLEDREVQTVPYFLSQTFPDDPLILDAAADTIEQWNVFFREAVAQAKAIPLDQVPPVLVMCNNPVAEGDHEVCGAPGRLVRAGDLRYSTLHWVESAQLEGPLGYGPSATDPETGEIISGRAYVYGSELNTYASYAVDVVRFMNGDLEGSDLANLDHIRDEVMARARRTTRTDLASDKLRDIPLGSTRIRDPKKESRRVAHSHNLERFDPSVVDARLQQAREAGVTGVLTKDEYLGVAASRLGVPAQNLTAAHMNTIEPSKWMTPTHLKEQQRKRRRAMARSLDYADMIDPNVIGLARAYEGRDDYDQMWRELRAEVFRSTALHEVGHTLGLRHNFQGTYDSLNYHPEYWEQRTSTLFRPTNMQDLYTLATPSEEQINGRMKEYQYSSIMDYGYTFSTDLQGLGLYDRAAIVYSYTAGSTRRDDVTDCTGDGNIASNGTCLVRSMGMVEVFAKDRGGLGRAGEILSTTDELGFRFDDATAPIVPYLERWHYTTVMNAFPVVNDAFDREWMRIADVVAARDGSDAERIRVPYLFCSDEWTGALLSCQVYDAGPDPFEMTRTIIDNYRTYYYFRNFKRDRLAWDPFDSLIGAFFYTFLPLSDYYQNWYLAPFGYDNVMDDYYWLAVNAGVNLIAESLATPPYGSFCTRADTGALFNLGDEPGLSPGTTDDYFLSAYCDETKDFYEVEQGPGRRRFTAYDITAGYNFADLPVEAGHWWTTLAAFWAFVDPEAFVLGTDADSGTFAISYYDYFEDEVNQMVDGTLTEDYPMYSPVLDPTTNTLRYRTLSPVYDRTRDVMFDPESGEELGARTGLIHGTAATCERCARDSDCTANTGLVGGSFCDPVGGITVCVQDCSSAPTSCGPGYSCNGSHCVPDSGSCDVVPSCDANFPAGSCDGNLVCVEGVCTEPWPVVETDASFSLAEEMVFYGMLYSTWNYSTRYNDRLNVFKLGTEEEIAPGANYEMVSFTDPISGQAYGALAETCDGAPRGGSTSLCGVCVTSDDCAGHTGNVTGTFCVDLAGERRCLVDCSSDPATCPGGTTCSADGNCEPDDNSCDPGDTAVCDVTTPLGECPTGQTCTAGVCATRAPARCEYEMTKLSGAVQIVRRGQVLADNYNTHLGAYWAYIGGDPDVDNALYAKLSRSEYELNNHIDKINTIRALFAIFGKVY